MAILRGGLLSYKEEAIGPVDGYNTVFSSSFKFLAGTIRVYLNGLEQVSPTDYTEVDDQTIEFANPPIGGEDSDKVLLIYQKA